MYTKFQLAAQYFPDSMDNAETAIRRLMRWIDQTKGLMPALCRTGYKRTQRYFSKQQTELIYQFLGDP